MSSDHFHRAARDGILDLLKEATRRDCNAKDEDGMTPTLWAAFEGNLEALRLLVGRGGDPEKSDNYGNTALHFSAARGHLNCVTFLVNFGVNLWALDIDSHTPKELAAMNDRQDILQYLDQVVVKQERTNPKLVKSLKEKAAKDAEKRSKDFGKVQEKAKKLAEKEQKRLMKERERMEKLGSGTEPLPPTAIPRASTVALQIRRDSRQLYGQSIKFSELVGNKGPEKPKLHIGAVYKKVQQQRQKTFNKTTSKSSSTTALNESNETSDFKVGVVENDGKRSVRSISGLRKNSEILYVPKYETNAKRGALSDVFNGAAEGNKESDLVRASSQPDFLSIEDNEFDGNRRYLAQPRGSIFERPGFGSVAFRNSITAQLNSLTKKDEDRDSANTGSDRGVGDSIGSAGSLANRNIRKGWEEDDLDPDEDEDEENEATPLHFFLAACGLQDFADKFIQEKIDLDSLMLITEEDLKSLGLPIGPRRKLLRAIAERRAALDDPGDLEDSRL